MVIDKPVRRGFTYGTLPRDPECGGAVRRRARSSDAGSHRDHHCVFEAGLVDRSSRWPCVAGRAGTHDSAVPPGTGCAVAASRGIDAPPWSALREARRCLHASETVLGHAAGAVSDSRLDDDLLERLRFSNEAIPRLN